MEKRFLEDRLAQGLSLEAVGEEVGKHPSTVGYWLKKHGLAACGARKYARRGALRKDELEALAEQGTTVTEMAERLDRNPSTVRYWLGRHEIGIVDRRGSRRRCGSGSRFKTFECERHGTTEFVLEGRGYYRCKRYRSEAVAKRRRTIKRQLVEEAGGACVLCGYSRWVGALQFHHVESRAKEFHLAQGGYSRSIARSRAEMKKCVLLCANCHSEVEGGFATLPLDSASALRNMDAERALGLD
jgi:DNA-binding transcriptional ArsR family regulator